jgi:hypothetical protein
MIQNILNKVKSGIPKKLFGLWGKPIKLWYSFVSKSRNEGDFKKKTAFK